jgi:hypothetical protein
MTNQRKEKAERGERDGEMSMARLEGAN